MWGVRTPLLAVDTFASLVNCTPVVLSIVMIAICNVGRVGYNGNLALTALVFLDM